MARGRAKHGHAQTSLASSDWSVDSYAHLVLENSLSMPWKVRLAWWWEISRDCRPKSVAVLWGTHMCYRMYFHSQGVQQHCVAMRFCVDPSLRGKLSQVRCFCVNKAKTWGLRKDLQILMQPCYSHQSNIGMTTSTEIICKQCCSDKGWTSSVWVGSRAGNNFVNIAWDPGLNNAVTQ